MAPHDLLVHMLLQVPEHLAPAESADFRIFFMFWTKITCHSPMKYNKTLQIWASPKTYLS